MGIAQREMRTARIEGSALGRIWSCGGRGPGENAGGVHASTVRSGRRRRFCEIFHLRPLFWRSRRLHTCRSIEHEAHPRRSPANMPQCVALNTLRPTSGLEDAGKVANLYARGQTGLAAMWTALQRKREIARMHDQKKVRTSEPLHPLSVARAHGRGSRY